MALCRENIIKPIASQHLLHYQRSGTSEKEEERKNIDNDNETKATDEIVEKLLKDFLYF